MNERMARSYQKKLRYIIPKFPEDSSSSVLLQAVLYTKKGIPQ